MCIRDFLKSRSVRFEVFLHRPSHSASHLAESVHVPGRCVAKGVLMKAGDAFALAVLPATHRIDMDRLRTFLGVDDLRIDAAFLGVADLAQVVFLLGLEVEGGHVVEAQRHITAAAGVRETGRATSPEPRPARQLLLQAKTVSYVNR